MSSGILKEIETLKKRVRAEPNDGDLLHTLGVALVQAAGKPDEGVVFLQRAVAADPTMCEAHNDLGLAYYTLGDYDAAAAALRAGLKHDAAHINMRVNLGNALRQQGDHDAALGEYQRARKAVGADDDNVTVLLNYGSVLHYLGRAADAREPFERVLELEPRNDLALLKLGEIASATNDYSAAIKLYEKAARENPDAAAPHDALGRIYEKQGKVDKAIGAYQRAVELDANDAYTLANLGVLQYQSGYIEASVESFERSLELDPDNANVHNNLGISYKALDQQQAALSHFTRAVELRPRLAYAIANLGHILDDMGLYEQAVDNFRRAVAIDGTDASWYKKLGVALTHLERFDEAVEAYYTGLAIDPNDATIHYNVAAAYGKQSRLDEAMMHCELCVAADPELAPGAQMHEMLTPHANAARVAEHRRGFDGRLALLRAKVDASREQRKREREEREREEEEAERERRAAAEARTLDSRRVADAERKRKADARRREEAERAERKRKEDERRAKKEAERKAREDEKRARREAERAEREREERERAERERAEREAAEAARAAERQRKAEEAAEAARKADEERRRRREEREAREAAARAEREAREAERQRIADEQARLRAEEEARRAAEEEEERERERAEREDELKMERRESERKARDERRKQEAAERRRRREEAKEAEAREHERLRAEMEALANAERAREQEERERLEAEARAEEDARAAEVAAAEAAAAAAQQEISVTLDSGERVVMALTPDLAYAELCASLEPRFGTLDNEKAAAPRGSVWALYVAAPGPPRAAEVIGCLADIEDLTPFETDAQLHAEGVEFQYIYRRRDEDDAAALAAADAPPPVPVAPGDALPPMPRAASSTDELASGSGSDAPALPATPPPSALLKADSASGSSGSGSHRSSSKSGKKKRGHRGSGAADSSAGTTPPRSVDNKLLAVAGAELEHGKGGGSSSGGSGRRSRGGSRHKSDRASDKSAAGSTAASDRSMGGSTRGSRSPQKAAADEKRGGAGSGGGGGALGASEKAAAEAAAAAAAAGKAKAPDDAGADGGTLDDLMMSPRHAQPLEQLPRGPHGAGRGGKRRAGSGAAASAAAAAAAAASTADGGGGADVPVWEHTSELNDVLRSYHTTLLGLPRGERTGRLKRFGANERRTVFSDAIEGATVCYVLQDSDWRPVEPASLVPGDVVLLKLDEVVPADVRVIASQRLQVDRRGCGGARVVTLAPEPDAPGAAPLDATSLALAGDIVTGGRGKGVVVRTGGATLCADREPKVSLRQRPGRFAADPAVAALMKQLRDDVGIELPNEEACALLAQTAMVVVQPSALLVDKIEFKSIYYDKRTIQAPIIRWIAAQEKLAAISRDRERAAGAAADAAAASAASAAGAGAAGAGRPKLSPDATFQEAFVAGDSELALKKLRAQQPTAKQHFNIAMVHMQERRWADAIAAFNHSLEKDSYMAVSYFQRGCARLLAGEHELAREDYDKAMVMMRGHEFVDYGQMGLNFRLLRADILINQALTLVRLDERGEARRAASEAGECEQVRDKLALRELTEQLAIDDDATLAAVEPVAVRDVLFSLETQRDVNAGPRANAGMPSSAMLHSRPVFEALRVLVTLCSTGERTQPPRKVYPDWGALRGDHDIAVIAKKKQLTELREQMMVKVGEVGQYQAMLKDDPASVDAQRMLKEAMDAMGELRDDIAALQKEIAGSGKQAGGVGLVSLEDARQHVDAAADDGPRWRRNLDAWNVTDRLIFAERWERPVMDVLDTLAPHVAEFMEDHRLVHVRHESDDDPIPHRSLWLDRTSPSEKLLFAWRGNLDTVLEKCERYMSADGSSVRLSDATRVSIRSTFTHETNVVAYCQAHTREVYNVNDMTAREFDKLMDDTMPQSIFVGAIVLQETVQAGVASAVERLLACGVKLVLCTHRDAQSARVLGNRIGMDFDHEAILSRQASKTLGSDAALAASDSAAMLDDSFTSSNSGRASSLRGSDSSPTLAARGSKKERAKQMGFATLKRAKAKAAQVSAKAHERLQSMQGTLSMSMSATDIVNHDGWIRKARQLIVYSASGDFVPIVQKPQARGIPVLAVGTANCSLMFDQAKASCALLNGRPAVTRAADMVLRNNVLEDLVWAIEACKLMKVQRTEQDEIVALAPEAKPERKAEDSRGKVDNFFALTVAV